MAQYIFKKISPAVGVVGPVQAKLLSFPPLRGWVFGAFGEASTDVHVMVDYLAEARQKHQQLLEGRWRTERKSQEVEVAQYKGQIRRGLSLEAVRSQARLLLGTEEWRMGRERRAHQLAPSQGCPVRARGHFFVH